MKIVMVILSVIGALVLLAVIAGLFVHEQDEGPLAFRHGKPDKYK